MHIRFTYGAAVCMVTKICGRWQEQLQLHVHIRPCLSMYHTFHLHHAGVCSLLPVVFIQARITAGAGKESTHWASCASFKAASLGSSCFRVGHFCTEENTFLSPTEQDTRQSGGRQTSCQIGAEKSGWSVKQTAHLQLYLHSSDVFVAWSLIKLNRVNWNWLQTS
jgi:hypothetical protein